MRDLWAVRRGNTLVPADIESGAVLARIPIGKPIRIHATKERNGAHHRLYWVMCQRIGAAIGQDADVVSDVLKIATGHCTTVKTKTHGWMRLPRSISWAQMDQTEFGKFYDRCIVVICEEFGLARPEVLDAVRDIIDGSMPEMRGAA